MFDLIQTAYIFVGINLSFQKMNADSALSREKKILHASAVGIIANLALCASKAIIGVLSNSIAIVLDAVNNLSDALSSVLTFAGISLANRPANREHPFGFGRFEYLTTMTIALIILATGAFSLVQSFKKALVPEQSEYSLTGLAILVIAIAAKLLMSRYFRKSGEAAGSETLKVTSSDALFDAVITTATLVSALVSVIFGDIALWLDGVLGVCISLVIVRAGIKMVMSPLDRLLGERVDHKFIETLKKEITSDDDVLGVYDIILHDYGPGRQFGSVYIGVEDTMTAHEVQDLTRRIQRRILGKYGILFTIGIHAMNWKDPQTKIMYDRIMDMLHKRPGVIEVHGLYIDPKDKTISLDAVADFSIKDLASFRTDIVREISGCYPEYRTDIIIDRDYSIS